MARIDKAMKDYLSLADEMDKFLYEYVKGMAQDFDKKNHTFILRELYS